MREVEKRKTQNQGRAFTGAVAVSSGAGTIFSEAMEEILYMAMIFQKHVYEGQDLAEKTKVGSLQSLCKGKTGTDGNMLWVYDKRRWMKM
ncbi:hypothetical protein A2U01_0046390 [Trifolium medium]|uniref:Uncharacterized protein n=1 Tax=Trifolium medium TaxID=97028 RepID=A0A392QLC0_9FABA|nr:hypothetical protein [Trifolium medium]